MKDLPRFDPRDIKVSEGQSEEQQGRMLRNQLDDFILQSRNIYPGEPAVKDFKGNAYRSIDDMIDKKTWDQRLAEERAGMPLASTTDHYPSYALKNPHADEYLMQWMGALRKKLGM